MSPRPALVAVSLALLTGCAATDSLDGRGASLSLRPPTDVARQLVGRWGAECKVVINGVGANGRVVGWGINGAVLDGRYREGRGQGGAAGVLTFKWPVAVIPAPSGFSWASANVVGGDLVYTFYPATARLRLTGPQPRWQNAGYPVSESFDLERCADGPEQAPRDWSPIG